MKTIALYLHKHGHSWVLKMPQKQYSVRNTPLGHTTDHVPMGLDQFNSVGEYCGRSINSIDRFFHFYEMV